MTTQNIFTICQIHGYEPPIASGDCCICGKHTDNIVRAKSKWAKYQPTMCFTWVIHKECAESIGLTEQIKSLNP